MKQQPHFMPKIFVEESERILKQNDGYSCGLYCNLFIMDLVITQWCRSYSLAHLEDLQRIGQITTITITDDYRFLGATFHEATMVKEWMA
jgi:hypothetical protein